jgi:vacuolar protein sorting-associated protein 41
VPATISVSYESSQMTRMAEGEGSNEPETDDKVSTTNGQLSPKTPKTTATDDTEEEEEEEEEPRLKYAPLTKNLTSLYRNGDASSAFLVAGDKMVGLLWDNHWSAGRYTNQYTFADCWYP